MSSSLIMSTDQEISQILTFIRQELSRLKHQDRGLLKSFARHIGLGKDVLSKFMRYEADSNPSFRTTYKILKGLLGKFYLTPEPLQLPSPAPLGDFIPEVAYQTPAPVDLDLIARSVQASEKYLKSLNLQVSDERKGNFVAKICEHSIIDHEPPEKLNLKAIFLITQ